MTEQEITTWMKEHKCIGVADLFIDSCGNEETTFVYTDGVKLFLIECLNGIPCEKWEGIGFNQGYVHGEYPNPIEVVRKTRMVEEVYYDPVEKTN